MFCSQCGADISETDRFCHSCGKTVAQAAPPPPPQPAYKPPPPMPAPVPPVYAPPVHTPPPQPAYVPPPPPPPVYAQPSYNAPPAYNQPPPYPQAPPPYGAPPYGAPPAYGSPAGYRTEVSGQAKLFAALAYFFPFIGPAIALVMAKGDKFVRFHGWQAGIYNAAFIVLWIAYFVVAMMSDTLSWLVYFLMFGVGVLAFIAFIMALMGKMFKIPLVGQIADRLSG